jgi:hypothetical protein
MIGLLLTAIAYLCLATTLEAGIFSQCLVVAPGYLQFLFALRLLALGAVLAGLLRGPFQGMAMAVACACVLGFSREPGVLGVTIISFGLTAALSGWAARHLLLHNMLTRWLTILFLLTVENLVWGLLRKLFWPSEPIVMSWLGLALTALVGTMIYALFVRKLKSIQPVY